MSDAIQKLSEIDTNIHQPARLMIVAILSAVEEADFLYLLQRTGLTKGNLSSHLSRLEKVGYVHVEKSFVGKITRTICRLTDEGREALEAYGEQIKAVL
ncbi:MAG: transcriptional regulator [Chloroflexi bacterium]|nr:transcriptional regulator [Chloroflexota bacterium]